MTFTRISQLIGKAVCKLGLERQARAALICEKYRKLAPQILGGKISVHAWPKYFRRKVLVVGVDHPLFASEMNQQKDAIIKLLNEALGKDTIKNIRTIVEKTED